MKLLEQISNLFGINKKELQSTNYKLKEFENVNKKEDKIQDYSVIKKYLDEIGQNGIGGGFDNFSASNLLYSSASTNKPMRLATYRRMINFPEVSDAAEEICDGMINHDENGKLINLKIVNEELPDLARDEIQSSFEELIELFDFDENMFEQSLDFITNGELCWENIISKSNPDYGIIGIRYIPQETFELCYDIKTREIKGIVVFIDTPLAGEGLNTNDQSWQKINHTNENKRQWNYPNISDLSHSNEIREKKVVFLPWNQITYIESGIKSSDKLCVYPILEKARKAYNQLTLIEDAIIIYRLVRAPERLVFNVDTGKLPRQRAEQEVLKMMKRYNTKQVYNPVNGTISNDYDPYSLVESFWFAKPEGAGGTSVETLAGGVNLGELDDLNYFLRKLYLSLKVPFNRYKEPTVNIERVDSINYEEYKFSKFVMRLQNCFSRGLKETFITHLKLKGLWDSLNLRERDFKIKFCPPSLYEIYETQKLWEMKVSSYAILADREEFSKELAMKKILGFTDAEIDENWNSLKDERVKLAKIEYITGKVSSEGTTSTLSKSSKSDDKKETFNDNEFESEI